MKMLPTFAIELDITQCKPVLQRPPGILTQAYILASHWVITYNEGFQARCGDIFGTDLAFTQEKGIPKAAHSHTYVSYQEVL